MFFKPKKKDVKWYFKGVIRGYINEYSRPESNPLFAQIYNTYIESKKDENLDEAINVLPKAEQRHKELIEELISISKNNSVFLSNKDETESFSKKNDLILWDKIYTQDIIKTLPLLIDFVEVHSVLMDSIYNGVFIKIILANELLWQGLHPSNDKYFRDVRTQEIKKEGYSLCYKTFIAYYDEYILDDSWKYICKENPGFDSDKYHKIFNSVSHDEDLISEWDELWTKKFESESRKNVYGAALFELQRYFDDILKVYGDYYWVKNALSGKPMLNSYSSFYKEDMMDCEIEDLITILQKYENGELSGRYIEK